MPRSWRTTSDTGGAGSGPGPPEGGHTAAELTALLAVARAAVTAAAHGEPRPTLPDGLPARLLDPAGAFVTLHRDGELRGCIGSVVPQDSLAALVGVMAAAAATRDPRFPPLRPEELAGLHVEISILSPIRPVAAAEIDPRRDGVSLRVGRHRAVLLPQVAAEHGWDRRALLDHLCEKAGAPSTAWQRPDAVFHAFGVETVDGDVLSRLHDGRIEEVLDFWFGAPGDDGAVDDAHRARWFAGDPDTDRQCRERLGAVFEWAVRGELDGWAATPRGRLALIVLVDQLSRSIHRATARAFAQDPKALALCRDGIERGMDRSLRPVERVFFYMPLQHAEDRDAQRLSVEGFEALLGDVPARERAAFETFLDYARRHRVVIERFGRFPHRNSILGRPSTSEESAFLATSDAPF